MKENSINEEEKKAIKSMKEFAYTIHGTLSIKEAQTVLNLLEKKDKQIEELKEIDEKRTWTVNNVIAEYIPDYELISLVNRYKDESFIPRVEVEKILNDRKK